MIKNLKEEYLSSLKSSDTEEHIDLAFYRPLGFAWAYLFRKFGVHPNAVTIASIFLGIGAGICFYYNNIWINITGILLLVWANTYDSCDGQLARITKQFSPLGRILDGMAGDIWFISIYLAIVLRSIRDIPFFDHYKWVIWIIAVIAGLLHARQASMADYYRQAHLFFLNGKEGSELDSSYSILRQREDLKRDKKWFKLIINFFYLNYTRSQEKNTPQFQRLKKIVSRISSNPQKFAILREEFLNLSRPLCKWENFLTFNWRSIFLFIFILIGYPWIYFVVEITIFSAVLVYMHIVHEKACKFLVEKFKDAA